MGKKRLARRVLWVLCAAVLAIGTAFLGYLEKNTCMGIFWSDKPQGSPTLTLSEDFQLTLSGAALPRDEEGVYYISQSMDREGWEGRLDTNEGDIRLTWARDEAFQDKGKAIREGHRFTLYLQDGQQWTEVQVLFTGLPVMTLTSDYSETFQEETGEEEMFWGDMVLFDPDSSQRYLITTSEVSYRERGAKSASHYPKVGYKLNLTKANGNNRHLSLLGMPADDDWIIRGLFTDPQKVREQVASELWNDLTADSPVNIQCSRIQYMELFLDGEYYGLVGLMRRTDGKSLDLGGEDILYKNTATTLNLDWNLAVGRDTLYQEGTVWQEGHPNPEEVESRKVRLIQCPTSLLGTGKEWEPLRFLWENMYAEGSQPNLQLLEENFSLENLIDFALFKQVTYAVDNEPNNMFFLARREGDSYRFYYIPWDMDYTFGSVGLETSPNFSRFKEEGAEVLADNGLLETLIAADPDRVIPLVQERWAQLRQGLFDTQNLLDRFAVSLEPLVASGAFERDGRRWPEQANDSDLSPLYSYMTQRMNFLDSYINGLGQEW